jgi:general secretion pathway protein K
MKAVTTPPRRAQRGVALITAMIIFSLAMILAADVVRRGYLDQRRAANILGLDQGYEIALGAEAWAADFLARDKRESGRNGTDNLAEAWAQQLPPLPLDNGGTVEGRLQDMQGRYNLNNLLAADGTPDPKQVQTLERILLLLDMKSNWAAAIADWLDADTQPGFPDGAEDSQYTSQTPPHLAANMAITRVSELLVLPGFGPENYRKLAPHVTALPRAGGQPTKLNVCTASGEVLDAMLDNGERNYSQIPAADLLKRRLEVGCFPAKADFLASLSDGAKKSELEKRVTDSSDYFRATIWVSIGTSEVTLYSLLRRGGSANPSGGGTVQPILRSMGTE